MAFSCISFIVPCSYLSSPHHTLPSLTEPSLIFFIKLVWLIYIQHIVIPLSAIIVYLVLSSVIAIVSSSGFSFSIFWSLEFFFWKLGFSLGSLDVTICLGRHCACHCYTTGISGSSRHNVKSFQGCHEVGFQFLCVLIAQIQGLLMKLFCLSPPQFRAKADLPMTHLLFNSLEFFAFHSSKFTRWWLG